MRTASATPRRCPTTSLPSTRTMTMAAVSSMSCMHARARARARTLPANDGCIWTRCIVRSQRPPNPNSNFPSSTFAGKKRRKKKDKDPNRPKKNMTAFFFFSADYRDEVKRENPDFKVADIGRELVRFRWPWAPRPTDPQSHRSTDPQNRLSTNTNPPIPPGTPLAGDVRRREGAVPGEGGRRQGALPGGDVPLHSA